MPAVIVAQNRSRRERVVKLQEELRGEDLSRADPNVEFIQVRGFSLSVWTFQERQDGFEERWNEYETSNVASIQKIDETLRVLGELFGHNVHRDPDQ